MDKWLMCACRLKMLDIAFMKAVHHKVNIVPVIAKADTLTKAECMRLKKRVSLIHRRVLISLTNCHSAVYLRREDILVA